MKVTKAQLKQLIKEELEGTLSEGAVEAGMVAAYKEGLAAGKAGDPPRLKGGEYMRGYNKGKDESKEQLDEGAMGMVMKVLQSPQAKEILKKMIMPMIQQALEKMNAPAPAAPAAPAPVAGPAE